MIRLAATLVLASLTVAPAMAQVINGETPLDETTLNRRTPGAADGDTRSAMPPHASSAEPRAPDAAPAPAAPRRD